MMPTFSPQQSYWEIVRLPSTGSSSFDGGYPPNTVDKPGSETMPINIDDSSSETESESESDIQIVPYALDVQPIGQGVPLNSMNRNCTGSSVARRPRRPMDRRSIEFHRRPAWLPVNWSMWKIIRVTGKYIGHVDVFDYPPDGVTKLRSKNDVFYYLITGTKRPKHLKIIHTPVDLEFDVPELLIWYGPEAGVIVEEATVGNKGTEIYPENYEFAGKLIYMKPPIGIKRVRVPAGTLYSAICKMIQ